MARLLSKVAVITASTDGIGYSIADKLLKEGAKVMISSRRSANVNYAVEKLKNKYDYNNIKGVVCNVTSGSDRKVLFDETLLNFGKIDILVSNAGTNLKAGPFFEYTEELWDKMFSVNVKSSFFLIKESLPYFKKNGSIIINSSIAGFNPIQSLNVYSITKTAIIGMVKALSSELANSPLEIRLNAIAPGIIKTKFSKMLHEEGSFHDYLMDNLHLKRFGTPEDCANLVAFLASDESNYITGETIVVAGGFQSRL